MDPKMLLELLSGVTPKTVSTAVKDLKSGKSPEVLQGETSPGLGGLVKFIPGVMKNGTKLLTRVSTVEDIPRRMLAMGKGNVNPTKAIDWLKPVTKAPSSRSTWDVVNDLAKKGKNRKAMYHGNKGPMTFLDGK